MGAPNDRLIHEVKRLAQPLSGYGDLEPLARRIAKKRCVLVGEATHGTQEFYAWRAELTKRLIVGNHVGFVAVEGDWPACQEINRFVTSQAGTSCNAREVLARAFVRWPTWMWANEEMVDFVEWLREYNRDLPESRKVCFYGLDLYSLWESLGIVGTLLKRRDPDSLGLVRDLVRCFELFEGSPQRYGLAVRWGRIPCERLAADLVDGLRRRSLRLVREPDVGSELDLEQNAEIVRNAEIYYRTMMMGGSAAWNVRDRHMFETLCRLMEYHDAKERSSRAIVWEHNTHIGDARHASQASRGEVSLGQLTREGFGAEGTTLIGFSTHRGTVLAAREWDAPPEVMRLPPGKSGSWEALLEEALGEKALLLFETMPASGEFFEMRGHRAIGVVYDPEGDVGNYLSTALPRRYDALIYLPETEALRPIPLPVYPDLTEEETYPSGF